MRQVGDPAIYPGQGWPIKAKTMIHIPPPSTPEVSKLFARRATCSEMNICGGPPIQTNIKRYNNDSNNGNKCKKVYKCLVFIENLVFLHLSSELRTELIHKRSTNFTEILLELYLIMNLGRGPYYIHFFKWASFSLK